MSYFQILVIQSKLSSLNPLLCCNLQLRDRDFLKLVHAWCAENKYFIIPILYLYMGTSMLTKAHAYQDKLILLLCICI